MILVGGQQRPSACHGRTTRGHWILSSCMSTTGSAPHLVRWGTTTSRLLIWMTWIATACSLLMQVPWPLHAEPYNTIHVAEVFQTQENLQLWESRHVRVQGIRRFICSWRRPNITWDYSVGDTKRSKLHTLEFLDGSFLLTILFFMRTGARSSKEKWAPAWRCIMILQMLNIRYIPIHDENTLQCISILKSWQSMAYCWKWW